MISVTFNGLVYQIPETGDESWGENLTSYFTAIPQGALQKSGGLFTLTAAVNFGPNFGLLAQSFSSRSSNPSTAGLLRLAVGDSLGWRNNANSGNLLLAVNASDQLTFNGDAIYALGITALTGDVTATGPGSVAATIAANAVTNSKLAQMAAKTVKANITGSTANPSDVSAVSIPTASTFMLRDSNANAAANNLIENYATTVTAAGTTTLTVSSAKNQFFTGTLTQDVVLPDATTLPQTGFQFFFVNTSLDTVAIKDNGGTLIETLPAQSFAFVTVTNISTANGVWNVQFITNNAGGGTVTSVGISVPTDILGVTGSPVTLAGTFQLGLKTQAANTFFAGPTGGANSDPTFRVINSVDIPQIANFCINSDFQQWNRGTSIAITDGTSAYQADRWYGKNSLGTDGVLTFSRVASTYDGSHYDASLQITTAPTASEANGCELFQTLENADSLALYNQNASFGIQVKALGNVNEVGVQFYSKTTEGKVDTPIGSEQTIAVSTGSYTRATIVNQAIGTSQTLSGVIGVRIRITGVSSGNTYDLNNGFKVTQAMMNIGSTPAQWRRANPSEAGELLACQRFYLKYSNTEYAANWSAGGFIRFNIPFPVSLRSSPSVSIAGSLNTDIVYEVAGVGTTGTLNDFQSLYVDTTHDVIQVGFSVNPSGGAGRITLSSSASIEYDAEI